MKILLLNLFLFSLFLFVNSFIDDSYAINNLFYKEPSNNHIVYEYRFDANRPSQPGTFVTIRVDNK